VDDDTGGKKDPKTFQNIQFMEETRQKVLYCPSFSTNYFVIEKPDNSGRHSSENAIARRKTCSFSVPDAM